MWWPSFVFLPLLMIAAVAVAVLLFTPTGVGVALAIADRFLGPSLEVRGWRGTIAGTLCADSVIYNQEGLTVELDGACVDPRLWASFDFVKVSIASLEATAIRVQTRPDSAAPDPSGRRDLSTPLRIELDRAVIGSLEIDGLRLDDVRTRIHLDNDDLDSDSSFNQDGRPVSLSTSGPWQRLAIEGSIGVPESVYIAGNVDLTQIALPYSATLRVSELDLGQWTGRELSLSEVQLGVTGDLTRYDYEISGRVRDGVIGEAQLRSIGAGDFEGLTLDAGITARPRSEVLGALDGLKLRGDLAWLPEFRFDLVAVADAVPVAVEDYRALLSGTVHGKGSGTSMEFGVDGLTGTVNDEAVTGSGRLHWSGMPDGEDFDLRIDDASFTIGAGALELDGDIRTGAIDLEVDARALSLPFVYAPLNGRLSGSIRLSGSMSAPAVAASVQVSELAYEGLSAGSATVDLRGGLERGTVTFEFDALSFEQAGSAEGADPNILIEGAATQGRLDYRRTGQRWSIDIGALSANFDNQLLGPVQFALVGPGGLQYENGQVELAEVCLQASLAIVSERPTEICGSLRYPQGPLRLQVAELRLLDFRTPINDVSLDATFGLSLNFETLAPLTGSGEVTIRDLVAMPQEDQRIPLGSLTGTLAIDAQSAALTLLTPRDQPLVLDGRMDAQLADDLPDSSLDGRISVDVDGIWAIETFLPMDVNYELAEMRGALKLNAIVAGTVAAPQVAGGISVSDAGWDVLAVGASFKDVGIEARLNETQTMNFTAQGQLGGGTFQISGDLENLASENRELSLLVELEPGRVIDLPDYRADLGGRVGVEMGPQSLQINGDLTMPTALIRIESLPDSAVSVSSDVVVIDENYNQVAVVQQVRSSEVKLTLGKDVRLQAFGLDTLLRGSLRVVERPDFPPDVRGTITLRKGVFEAYGQELEVERGALNFVGPVDDPNIDVLASRKVTYGDSEVTVSLLLGGTAKAITTEVRSTPPLPEGDALALLMTGRTLSEMSSQEQTNVYGAAIALGLYGASSITETMASTLGLEEIIVEQDSLGEVKVGAAVRLNKNLYLRYTYGVFSRLGGVLLRYRLSNRLSVQGQAGDAQSIEIRYGVDG